MFEGILLAIEGGFLPGSGGDLGDLGESIGGVGRLRAKGVGVWGLFDMVSIPRPMNVGGDKFLSPACSCAASSSLRVGSLMGDLAPFLCTGFDVCQTAAAPFTEIGGIISSVGPELGSCLPAVGGSTVCAGFCGSGDLSDLMASGGPTDDEDLRGVSPADIGIAFCLNPGDDRPATAIGSLGEGFVAGE